MKLVTHTHTHMFTTYIALFCTGLLDQSGEEFIEQRQRCSVLHWTATNFDTCSHSVEEL